MEREVIIKVGFLKSFSIKARLRSFKHAIDGVVEFFNTQHNAIIHLLMTVIVFIAGIIFKISRMEIIAVGFATGFVWTAELFNTAVEKLADMVSKEFDLKIKFIKDVSAAAVLIAAITAFLTGVIVFVPKFFP